MWEKITVIILAALQVFFWNGVRFGEGESEVIIWEGTRSFKPELGIVPPVPRPETVKALSLGDEQFYFRQAAFRLQNAGDTFGRVTSLKNYDYSALYQWWKILDSLDAKSDFTPSLVSYYYGSSQDAKSHVPYVVKYLHEHGASDPERKWWWYSQAVYHAKHRLKDNDLALEIATEMAQKVPKGVAPLWVYQMPAFILEDKGEYKAACDIILNIIDTYNDVTQGEQNFMNHFLEERIGALVANEDKIDKSQFDPRCLFAIEKHKEINALQ